MERADRLHRGPGRRPKISSSGRPVKKGDGQIATPAGTGRMIGSVPAKERAEEAPHMPTPTGPLSTSPPS